jgi:exosortase/archaeosortase family protein
LTAVFRKNKYQTFKRGLINLTSSFSFAYCITLVVNTIRILGAIFLHWNQVSYGWLSPSRIHRLEGTVFYFVSLVMVYGLLKKSKKIKNSLDSSFIKGPVFWYLLITVFFPFFTRFIRKDFSGYIEHCAFVLTTVLLICIILKLFKRKKTSSPG